MKRKLITAASTYPISLTEAKAHLRVDSTDDDTYITSLIAVAAAAVENYSGWQLMAATYEIAFDGFQDTHELLPHPYKSDIRVSYYSSDNNDELTELNLDVDYRLDDYSMPSNVYPVDAWPSDVVERQNPVIVRFVAGHATAAAVPAQLKQAMLLMIGHYYEHREDQSDRQTYELPQASKWLMDQIRIYNF